MWPDRVSNPGSLTYKSGALPTALRGPADNVYVQSLHVRRTDVPITATLWGAIFSPQCHLCTLYHYKLQLILTLENINLPNYSMILISRVFKLQSGHKIASETIKGETPQKV